MYAIDFEFDGKRLSEFGCILTSFEGATSGVVPSGADVVFTYTNPLGSDIYSLHTANYNSPYTTSFSICKNPCEYDDNMSFTPQEASAIQRWLCRRMNYCKFKILRDGYEDIYWIGSFTSQQYVICGEIIGFNLTFTADAPYAYLDDVTLHYTCSANSSFSVDSISDEEGYIIPDMKIAITQGGNFTLTNNRDVKIFTVNNCTANETITINGKTLIIDSNNVNHDLSQDFNYAFPKLFNTYSNTINTFTPSLGCTIDITYRPAIKVGA